MAEAKEKRVSLATLEATPDHMAIIDKGEAKVGGKVRLVIYGTLKEFAKTQSDLSQEDSNAGKLTIAVSNVRFASNNEIAELFDEELDG